MLKCTRALTLAFFSGYLFLGCFIFSTAPSVLAESNGVGNALDNDTALESAVGAPVGPESADGLVTAFDYLNAGGYVCPSEGFHMWALKNINQIIVLRLIENNPDAMEVMNDESLSPDEKQEKINELVSKQGQMVHEDLIKAYSERDYWRSGFEQLSADWVPIVIAVAFGSAVVIVTSCAGAHWLMEKTRIYALLTRLCKGCGDVAAASLEVSANNVYAALSSCVKSTQCGKRCSLNRYATTYFVEPRERIIRSLPLYQIKFSLARIAYQFSYDGWIEYARDVVVPVSLAIIHGGAQLSKDSVGLRTLETIETAAANVAYASVSSSLNSSDILDQGCYILKNAMTNGILNSVSRTGMLFSVMGKGAAGLLCNACESTVNSLMPLAVATTPVVYLQSKGQNLPGLNIQPKYLFGGALILGDGIAAVQDGHPEYLMIPLIVLTARFKGGNRAKAFGWGVALLYAPLNYYLGDTVRDAWGEMFGAHQ